MQGVDTNDSIDLPTFAEFVAQGRDHRAQDIRALVVRDIMLVILLFHPFVSGLAMKAWKCTEVISSDSDEPIKYLTTDMTIRCFTSSNWIGIAVFSAFTIVFFSLGAPALLFYTLARRRDQLGEKDTYKSLGILKVGLSAPSTHFQQLFWLRKHGFLNGRRLQRLRLRCLQLPALISPRPIRPHTPRTFTVRRKLCTAGQ